MPWDPEKEVYVRTTRLRDPGRCSHCGAYRSRATPLHECRVKARSRIVDLCYGCRAKYREAGLLK